jgi:stearoyl-CoA desaturase (Delta-9 desaturase)
VHHASWAVGSISHLYGQRPFKTDDHSANNFWVALVAFGEGLQNNHHAFPSAARHAFRWWEPDLTGYLVSVLAATGLIWNVAWPSDEAISRRRRSLTGRERSAAA